MPVLLHIELRLGNWFNDPNGSPVQVHGIIQHIQGALVNPMTGHGPEQFTGLEPDACTPIPITPDLLRQSGFEGRGKAWHMGAFILTPAPDGFVHSYGGFLTLRYVHQLQNLFFAITGEEISMAFESSSAPDEPATGAPGFSAPGRIAVQIKQREDDCIRQALRQMLNREPRSLDVKNCQRLLWEGVSDKWVLAYKGMPLGSIQRVHEGDEVDFRFTAGDLSL